MCASRCQQHSRRDFAGKCAFFFPVHVLTADADVAFPHHCRHGSKARKRRADNNLLRGMRFKVGQAFIQELFGMGGRLVHLPVGGN